MKASMRWEGGLRFGATGAFGHEIHTDGARTAGGGEQGFKPTELLLWGIAGCTGIDVVRVLEKQRQVLTSLEILVEAEQDEDYPNPFHTITVTYRASGDPLDEEKLRKAVELSEGKYCVVSQTVQRPTEVRTRVELVDGPGGGRD